MKVLILHTAPPQTVDPGRRVWEFDLEPAACGIATVLPGATVARVRGEPREILSLLEAHAPDVVFNLCEAPLGRPELEPQVAALLEWAGVRFTGSGSETLALCRRKDRVAAVLAGAGVPVPHPGGFPCIVKPADQDGSAGIDHHSVCEDATELAGARAKAAGPVVIEEFLPGREFVVSLWGQRQPEHVSIGETLFQHGLRLITYAAKWDIESADYANSPLSYAIDLDPPLRASIVAAAQGAWRAVGARGYARIDVRLDAAGHSKVLDVNPNPEIGPEVGIHRAVLEAGWTWPRFIHAQLAWA
jgi:D-alanine-D-alanine ligase